MKFLREQDDQEWKNLIKDLKNEEDDEEEENFAWYDINDKDQYFMLTTMQKVAFKKNHQVFHCYGRRNNQCLLANYGFVIPNNRYNSYMIKVNIDFGWKDKEKDMKVQKRIRLKEATLNDQLFGYIRANLMN